MISIIIGSFFLGLAPSPSSPSGGSPSGASLTLSSATRAFLRNLHAHSWPHLVNARFLTDVNRCEPCPAFSAAGRPLTILFVDFVQLSSWPEACSPDRRKC